MAHIHFDISFRSLFSRKEGSSPDDYSVRKLVHCFPVSLAKTDTLIDWLTDWSLIIVWLILILQLTFCRYKSEEMLHLTNQKLHLICKQETAPSSII